MLTEEAIEDVVSSIAAIWCSAESWLHSVLTEASEVILPALLITELALAGVDDREGSSLKDDLMEADGETTKSSWRS